MLFRDRKEAGKKLASALEVYKENPETVVLGLARGGVAVAAEIAQALHLPLGVVVVRKIGAPGNEELAVGAVTQFGEQVWNQQIIAMLAVSQEYLLRESMRQQKIAQERSSLYLQGKASVSLREKRVILVDDGIATGASVRAAIVSLKKEGVKEIVLAVPVAAPDTMEKMRKEVDKAISLHAPYSFSSVGSFYKEFPQVSDEEVVLLLSQ